MSAAAPPKSPRPDALEALIREARARQRRRWLGGAAVVAVLAGAALGITSIVSGGSSHSTTGFHRGAPVTRHNACGIEVQGIRILRGGQTVYREPTGDLTHPNGGPPAQVQCSGGSIWVVWPFQGGEASQEAYFGVHSSDGGRTWRAVFNEGYFPPKAPHQLDAYLGIWAVRGPHDAYFTGSCPACSLGTVSLWVTKDGGRTFREYHVPALTGYTPMRIRVSGDEVTIWGRRVARKTNSAPYEIYRHTIVRIRVA